MAPRRTRGRDDRVQNCISASTCPSHHWLLKPSTRQTQTICSESSSKPSKRGFTFSRQNDVVPQVLIERSNTLAFQALLHYAITWVYPIYSDNSAYGAALRF